MVLSKKARSSTEKSAGLFLYPQIMWGEKERGQKQKGGRAMPYKPKKPCAWPGCPNLTDGKYCPEHQKEANARYEKYGRDPAVHRRYGRAWKRIRDSYVKSHPYCELCLKQGMVVPVEEVHHIKPLSEGGTHARDNLISLCKSCHARIHAQRGDRWHKRRNSNEDEE